MLVREVLNRASYNLVGPFLESFETALGKHLISHVMLPSVWTPESDSTLAPALSHACEHISFLTVNQRSPTFWYQGPVSWKTVFPRTGAGVRGELVQAVMPTMGEKQMKLRSLTCHSPAARPIPNRLRPGTPFVNGG